MSNRRKREYVFGLLWCAFAIVLNVAYGPPVGMVLSGVCFGLVLGTLIVELRLWRELFED